jgi:hypothetical protein
VVLEARNSGGDITHHHGGEERLLPWKPGIDRRLPGTGEFGDFVDTRAGKPALQKDAAGRIEDAGVDLAGELARRPPRASGGPLACVLWVVAAAITSRFLHYLLPQLWAGAVSRGR